jgi:hypothetical protein
LGRADAALLLRQIGQLNRFWDGLVTDEAAFFATLSQTHRPTLAIVLDALYRLQSPPGTVRWGDKTPLYIQYIPQILAIFPRAQFIHVIRDGRDAALSARAKWGHFKPYMDLSYLLRNWVRNVRSGRELGRPGQEFGRPGLQQYYELRYETLVTDPAGSLQAICDYLGEAYDPAMLDYRQAARQEGGGIDAHVEAQEELHGRSIGRWQREMTLFERKLSRAIAGPLLDELNYDPDENLPPLTAADRVRLAWLSVRFCALDSLRTWLYRRGLRTLNYNRRQRHR